MRILGQRKIVYTEIRQLKISSKRHYSTTTSESLSNDFFPNTRILLTLVPGQWSPPNENSTRHSRYCGIIANLGTHTATNQFSRSENFPSNIPVLCHHMAGYTHRSSVPFLDLGTHGTQDPQKDNNLYNADTGTMSV